MEIESALVAKTDLVAEAAVVGRPDETTGEAICAFVVLKRRAPDRREAKKIANELRNWVAKEIGPIAKPKDIRFGDNLPKTRSGKIMRRLLRSIAKGEAITQDTSRRTSRDASARPIRTIRGGVEYAPIVQRAAAIIGSAIFLVIAPGTLAVYVPWYLTHWHFAPPLFPIARVLGAALIVAGLPILLDSFARFALQGLGTPAPVMPPKRLVVTGLYRYVRNPMYVAVTALIAGQGLPVRERHGAGVRRDRVGRILLVRCRLRRACAGRAVRRRVQALPGEREAMVTAHHPMARVGGKNAACASSSSIAAATTIRDRRC